MITKHSYNDVEFSNVIVCTFVLLTILTDIIIIYKVHLSSLQISKSLDKKERHKIIYGGTKPWKMSKSIQYASLSHDDDMKEVNELNVEDQKLELTNFTTQTDENQYETPNIMEQSKSDISYFGEQSWFKRLVRYRSPRDLIHLLPRCWSLCCGIISLYISTIFYMNIIIEYILICIAVSWIGIFAAFAILFLVVCISWFIRRQFESLVILFKNTLDYHSNNKIYCDIWRICNLLFCVIFAIITAYYNDIVPFSDVLFFQMFLSFMFIFAISFQILYILCTIIASVWVLIQHRSTEHFLKLLCGIEHHETDTMCWKIAQYLVLIVLCLLTAVFIILYIVRSNQYQLFLFAAIIVIVYWLITILESAKCNALFLLWSNRFQQKYLKRAEVIDQITSNEETEVMEIKYMENLWKNVYYDYENNGHFGFNKYFNFCRDFWGWICILTVFFVFIFITYRYLLIDNNEKIEGIIINQQNNIASLPTYPICDMRLRRNDYLSAMDLVYLTKTTYYASTKEQILTQFSIWFGHQYEELWDISTLSNHTEPSFYHIYNKQHNFDLIVVRGTDDKLDVYQDISLWSEVSTFQIFSALIPLTELFPMSFVRNFVKTASFAENIIAPQIRSKYDNPVYKFAKDNIMTNGDDYVIIAGHSLGGGIAQIVAAKLFEYDRDGQDDIISFGLSSPGTLYSSKKFGFSPESLDKTSISILPRRDIVTMVDNHGGVVQIIECDVKKVYGCHFAQNSFCELYQQCGNHTTRNISFAECVCVGIGKINWENCF